MKDTPPQLRLTHETDPVFDALLDQALAPEVAPGGIPAGLADRILAMTTTAIERRRHSPRNLIIRLDSYRWTRALAASLLVAASAGVLLTAGAIFQSAQTTVELHSLDRDLHDAMVRATATPTIDGPVRPIHVRAGMDVGRVGSEVNEAMQSLDEALRQFDQSGTRIPFFDSSTRIF
ncbi:MAG: hypothetical protein WD042_00390 [Phycisphaeraceae bacterium]